ncbi:MAG: phosphotransferase [Fodinibius sp.]|nr:phosphotransferase [Fodinibius sp.]
MIPEEKIFAILSRHLTGFNPVGELQPLMGGNLNHVWRLQGQEQSLIIKYAPPHIATNPEVPLSPKRLTFEARALALFADDQSLHPLASDEVRPPRRLHFDRSNHLLIMEDMGGLPSLADWIEEGIETAPGQRLGRFIGQLHCQTYGNDTLAKQFHNRDIQQVRQKVQYNPAADYLSQTVLGDVDFNLVAQKTKALGQKLLEPGKCLVMGDLWPPSVLVDNGMLRLIDWEFAHFGRPLQDVGHFAAHCWMQAHRSEEGSRFRKLWETFWTAYQQVLGDTFEQLFDKAERDAMATHAGAEIWVRAAGPFQEGYVYEGLAAEELPIREAIARAVELIVADDNTALGDDW